MTKYSPPSNRDIDEGKRMVVYLVGTGLAIILFMSLNWVIYLYKIQFEKENLLRFASNLMGMKSLSYWFSSLLFQFGINFISFFITYALGLIFGVYFFRLTNPLIILVVFPTIIYFCLISSVLMSILIQNLKLSIVLGVLWNFVSLVCFYIGYAPRVTIFEPLFLLSPSYNIGKIIGSIQIFHFALGTEASRRIQFSF